MYLFSTRNAKDFRNLLDVYLDATFFPHLSEDSFKQEGIRFEFEDPADPKSGLRYKGVVFNEMKGALATPGAAIDRAIGKTLFQGLPYEHVSGGDPQDIPNLTWEQLRRFHGRYYHPSNARFYTYGDQSLETTLEVIERAALSRFQRIEVDSSIPNVTRLMRPAAATEPYPAAAGEDNDRKAQALTAWVTERGFVSDPRHESALRGAAVQRRLAPAQGAHRLGPGQRARRRKRISRRLQGVGLRCRTEGRRGRGRREGAGRRARLARSVGRPGRRRVAGRRRHPSPGVRKARTLQRRAPLRAARALRVDARLPVRRRSVHRAQLRPRPGAPGDGPHGGALLREPHPRRAARQPAPRAGDGRPGHRARGAAAPARAGPAGRDRVDVERGRPRANRGRCVAPERRPGGKARSLRTADVGVERYPDEVRGRAQPRRQRAAGDRRVLPTAHQRHLVSRPAQ